MLSGNFSYKSSTQLSLSSGQIDDVRIYATALQEEDIKELYQQRTALDLDGNFYQKLKLFIDLEIWVRQYELNTSR